MNLNPTDKLKLGLKQNFTSPDKLTKYFAISTTKINSELMDTVY
jgi:hypothetical protein